MGAPRASYSLSDSEEILKGQILTTPLLSFPSVVVFGTPSAYFRGRLPPLNLPLRRSTIKKPAGMPSKANPAFLSTRRPRRLNASNIGVCRVGTRIFDLFSGHRLASPQAFRLILSEAITICAPGRPLIPIKSPGLFSKLSTQSGTRRDNCHHSRTRSNIWSSVGGIARLYPALPSPKSLSPTVTNKTGIGASP